MGQKQKQPKKGELPAIVIELTQIVAGRDANGQARGPMTSIAMMGKRAKQILELAEVAEDGRFPKKFLGVAILAGFADRVLADHELTWQLLDQVDAGEVHELPAAAVADEPPADQPEEEAQEGNDVDNTDSSGADDPDAPSRSEGDVPGDPSGSDSD